MNIHNKFMHILINDEAVSIGEGQYLSEVLRTRGLKDRGGIAIAINEEVVPRHKWANTKLNENDKLLIISATQGG